MLRFQPLITTGAGLLLVLPALTLDDGGDLSSLTSALRDTERALEVLRGIETEVTTATEPTASTGPLLRSVTETPYADGPTRDADLERLRNEVGLLQVELDALDAQAFHPSPLLPPFDNGGHMDLPTPTRDDALTTGMTVEQRAALFGGTPAATDSIAGTAPMHGGSTTKGPSMTAGGATPKTGSDPRHGASQAATTEAPGYSADPVRHAQTLFRAGRYKEGFALISSETEPSAVYLQARFLEKLGRLDEAITALESVVDALPAGYEGRRAKSDLEFFKWKRDFLSRLPEDAAATMEDAR